MQNHRLKTKQRAKQAVAKTYAEFFAGIGLVGAALNKSDWTCVYANDIDPKKREIYLRNFAEGDIYHEGDIWETDNVVSRIPGRPFLATASFPCIDLSLAGHWKGLDGAHSSTFFGFTQIVETLKSRKPRIILVENVTGFITSGKGSDFIRAAKELARLGYWVDSFVLDAKLFVPQSRPRIFLVGVEKSVKSELLIRQTDLCLGDPWQAAIEKYPSLRPNSLRKLMESAQLATGWVATPIKPPRPRVYDLSKYLDADDEQAWWSEEDIDKHYGKLSDRHRAVVDDLCKSGTEVIGTGYRRKRNGSTKLEVRFDGIAGCLRTPRGGSARQIVVHIKQGKFRVRWMSGREYSRLQGVGRFQMVDNERQMLFGFGDAVCVPVISWIDDCVLTPLYEVIAERSLKNGR